jgi:hypothetical protein
VVFEPVEVIRPELPVRSEPFVELRERFGTDPVQPPLRIRAHFDQPGILQDAKVLRHGRLTDAEPVDEVAYPSFAVAEQIEDLQTPRLGKHLERSGSGHVISIPMQLYACQGMELAFGP